MRANGSQVHSLGDDTAIGKAQVESLQAIENHSVATSNRNSVCVYDGHNACADRPNGRNVSYTSLSQFLASVLTGGSRVSLCSSEDHYGRDCWDNGHTRCARCLPLGILRQSEIVFVVFVQTGQIMTWEYAQLTALSPDTILQKVNSFGKEGWELVSVVLNSNSQYVAFLKRSLADAK